MAENKKNFYIEIGGIKESVTNLESLEQVLDKVEAQVAEINKNGGFTVANKESAKALKEQIELEKANQTIVENSQKSYREKQKVLSALGKVIKSMNADTKEEKERQEALKAQYRDLNAELKAFDATMGNHQREVGSYKEAIKAATQELKQMKGEMLGLDQHSDRFAELSKRAGELKDRIGDVNEAIKRQSSDTRMLDNVIDYARTATAAFELFKGAMSAFGIETDDATKAMQELLGTMSIIQSLQELSATLQSTSASGKLYHGILQALGIETKTVTTETVALNAAEATMTTTTKGLNVALKATRVALSALGIGIVIGLVAELVEHWEDLCNWVDELIPGLNRTGGLMNNLIGVCRGLGRAVITWLVNPFKTFAKVMGAILKGDFETAGKAIVDFAKNQASDMVNAFKSGYQAQVEKGIDALSRKKAAADAKDLEHHRNMITKQKNADGTYRKEYIEASKKMFDKKKQQYKKDSDEYKKVLEEEAKFYQQVEDAKEAAAENARKKKEAADKKSAADAKKAAAEAERKRKEEEKEEYERQKRIQENMKAANEADSKITELFNSEELRKLNLELSHYVDGPLDKYLEVLDEIYNLQMLMIDNTKNDELWKIWNNASAAAREYIKDIKELYERGGSLPADSLNLEEELQSEVDKIAKQVELLAQTTYNSISEVTDKTNQQVLDAVKKNAELAEKEVDKTIKEMDEKVKKANVDPVRNKIFGFIDEKATIEKYNLIRDEWKKAYDTVKEQIDKSKQEWNSYINHLGDMYGKDSQKYKEAIENYEETVKKYKNILERLARRANPNTSTDNDYNDDGKKDVEKKKLWDSEKSVIENLGNLFDELDRMVLGHAMDTFQMYMDFAIEETEQKLEQVENLHDKAMDKVQASADKIKELNDSLKDSSNTNINVTKQQLAEEQLLYAQRLAEEQKLQQQETSLKNKAAKQEATARKMELGYQLVMSIANAAQGASKALAQWGWPTGPIFAGIMAALGAAQTAIIAKQIGAIKPVKYADGGLIQGPSHAAGGVPVGNTGIEVEGGEAVINKRSTAKYGPLLDAINAAGNGGKHTLVDKKIRKFANGGTLNFDKVDETLRTSADTNKLLNAIENIDFEPVVSVVDINRVNSRLTKVKSLAGR